MMLMGVGLNITFSLGHSTSLPSTFSHPETRCVFLYLNKPLSIYSKKSFIIFFIRSCKCLVKCVARYFTISPL